jgi:hypothetical protein
MFGALGRRPTTDPHPENGVVLQRDFGDPVSGNEPDKRHIQVPVPGPEEVGTEDPAVAAW